MSINDETNDHIIDCTTDGPVYPDYLKTFQIISLNKMVDVNSDISQIKTAISNVVSNQFKIDNIPNVEIIDNIIDKLNDLKKLVNPDNNEPLLKGNHTRLTMYPIEHQDIWEMYKTQQSCYWKAEEIDFSNDARDFETLDEKEKHFLKWILAFFAASDGIVNFNLITKFMNEVKVLEVQVLYSFQIMMENIHSEVYSLMLDNIIKDKQEKDHLFNAIETIPSVKKMADWAFKWSNSSKPYPHRLIAFALVEGVFFSGAFAVIFWFKKFKNKGEMFLQGLTKSNEFISRDEGMHCDAACLFYSKIKNKLDVETVYEIVTEAVDVSTEFMDSSLPYDLLGMNAKSMGEYIQFIADRLLVALNYPKKYNTKNPFKFMETIGLPGKTNFFEMRATEYQDAHIKNANTHNYFNSSNDEDF